MALEDGPDLAPFIDLLPEATLLLGADGRILAANARARTALGTGAVVGTPLFDIADDAPERLREYLTLCTRSTDPLPGVVHLKRSSGTAREFRAYGWTARRMTAEGVLLRLIPKAPAVARFLALNTRIEQLSREVSLRLRAEQTLRDQRELLHVTLGSIGDAVVTTDVQGNVTFMNPVAEGLTGWKLDEALESPLEQIFVIINEENEMPVDSPVRKVLQHGVIVGLANHTVLVRRDGARVPIDDSGAPILSDRGELLGVVLVFHEVGERRRMERELRQQAEALREADKRKDQFLAMLAHELRNPLAPLRNCVEILKAHEDFPVDSARLAAMMERQTAQLSRLVDDLLDISRITHGTIRLKQQPTALSTIIEHAVETVRPLIEQRRHQLHVRLPPDTVIVNADLARLSQVFCNLLNNAAKFMDPGGQIFLDGEMADTGVVVRIRDLGEGLSADLLPHVFDLFAQGHRGLDREQGGLGIGLTLVRTLVQMHGGSVEATSPGAGQGSTFSVRLPIAIAEQLANSAAARKSADVHKSVLIVDDNVDAAASLALLLESWGCEVRVAHDGRAALDKVRAAAPDAVLLDIGLPGMDGFEVALRIRSLPTTTAPLIIAVTGYGSDVDRQRSADAGFDYHLSKPVDLPALKQLLE